MKALIFEIVLVVAALKVCECSRIAEYFDIDTTGKREWRLAFRATANVGESVYDAYMQNQNNQHIEDACKTTDWRRGRCNSHYRNNDAVDNFREVKEVKFAIIKDGVIAKTVTFNGRGKDKLSWFSKDSYIRSRWQDVEKSPSNIWSMSGDDRPHHSRRFFMQSSYAGCDHDIGWFVIIDSDMKPCQWEQGPEKFPVFKFAPETTLLNWKDSKVEHADGIAIFFKYESGRSPGVKQEEVDAPVNIGQYFDVLNTGRKQYRLAFRATPNIGESAYDAYTQVARKQVEPGCKTINWWSDCRSHYRNNAAFKTFTKRVVEVLFAIVKNGRVVKTMTFNARNQVLQTWFSKCTFIRSTYSDIQRSPANIFSIPGHAAHDINRRFFVQRSYGGCDHDYGWFVTIDGDPRPCLWEQDLESFPIFKFAPGTSAINWKDPSVEKADAIAIFFKERTPNPSASKKKGKKMQG